MDIHARCGGSVGTVRLDYQGWNTVAALKERIVGSKSATLASDLMLLHDGRVCPDGARLAFSGILSGSHIDVSFRLRGGGGDGGSTGAESRSSYLEMYAQRKPDKVNPEEEMLARWTTCKLSGERLSTPVCADEMGSLYNKSAVVAALLSKSLPPWLAHISSLRHLIHLKLEPNSQADKVATKKGNGTSAGNFQMNNGADYACPLTGLPMNGRYRFSALRKTGHVISEKALKEVPAAVEELVGGKWEQEDVLPLNGTPEEVQQLREQMLLQRAAAKAKKEKKKAGKVQVAAQDGASGVANGFSEKHVEGIDAGVHAGNKRNEAEVGGGLADEKAQVKKFKATESAPKLASKQVWASIFTSSRPEEKETYGCRALSSRGLA